jgi:hypothetical protein
VTDTPEENTRWVYVWVSNDPDETIYFEALRIAKTGDTDKLREFIVDTLRGAKEETSAWYINKEMTDADFETVDWEEIRADLVA